MFRGETEGDSRLHGAHRRPDGIARDKLRSVYQLLEVPFSSLGRITAKPQIGNSDSIGIHLYAIAIVRYRGLEQERSLRCLIDGLRLVEKCGVGRKVVQISKRVSLGERTVANRNC